MASGQIKNVNLSSDLYTSGKLIKIARGELGVTEYKPNNKRQWNDRVAEYFRVNKYQVTKTQNPLNTPWCAIFIGWVLSRAGLVGTFSASSRSYLTWGTCVYDKKSNKGSISDAKPDDIVIQWRGKCDDGVTGHIYFYLKQDNKYIYGIGGNQSDTVTEAKFLKSRVISIRRPRNVKIASKTIISAGGSATTGTAAEVVKQVGNTPVPPIDTSIEAANKTVEALSPLGGLLPTIAIILTVLSVGLALLTIWWRYRDYKETGL